jgi:hypothetical protein
MLHVKALLVILLTLVDFTDSGFPLQRGSQVVNILHMNEIVVLVKPPAGVRSLK